MIDIWISFWISKLTKQQYTPIELMIIMNVKIFWKMVILLCKTPSVALNWLWKTRSILLKKLSIDNLATSWAVLTYPSRGPKQFAQINLSKNLQLWKVSKMLLSLATEFWFFNGILCRQIDSRYREIDIPPQIQKYLIL